MLAHLKSISGVVCRSYYCVARSSLLLKGTENSHRANLHLASAYSKQLWTAGPQGVCLGCHCHTGTRASHPMVALHPPNAAAMNPNGRQRASVRVG